MAAKHLVNPNQLKMFMSADEITAHYQPLDADRNRSGAGLESTPELYARKNREFQQSGMTPSIARHGVIDPVHLGTAHGREGKPQIMGGHHRIASSMDLNPHRLMPVLHHQGGIEEMYKEFSAPHVPFNYT